MIDRETLKHGALLATALPGLGGLVFALGGLGCAPPCVDDGFLRTQHDPACQNPTTSSTGASTGASATLTSTDATSTTTSTDATSTTTTDATTSTSATTDASTTDASTTDATTDATTMDGTTTDATTMDGTTDGAAYGDGVLDPGEGCDDGPDNGDDKGCKLDCTPQACGDGLLGPGEGCDDGNVMGGDGCNPMCVSEACGDNQIGPGEACDDGQNGDPDDGCTDLCTLPACGDALLQPSLGETCDARRRQQERRRLHPRLRGRRLRRRPRPGRRRAVRRRPRQQQHRRLHPRLQDRSLRRRPPSGRRRGLRRRQRDRRRRLPRHLHGRLHDDARRRLCLRAAHERRGALLGRQRGRPARPREHHAFGRRSGRATDAGRPLRRRRRRRGQRRASTCAVLASGAIRCVGANQYGQLGINSTIVIGDAPGELPPADSSIGKPARALFGGGSSSCALTTDDALRCWGQNVAGELGLGFKSNNVGDAPGELPKLDIPVGFTPVQVVFGNQHICARSAAGKVRCWGGNNFGQLGYGNTTSLGDNPGELPTADVNIGGTAIDISAGLQHSCAILNTGAVRCWGNNDFGQLGLGNKTVIGDGPGEMPPASVDLGGLATRLACGPDHTCALLDDGKVRCWGDNAAGQLGLGNTTNIGDGPGEMPPADAQLGAPALAIYGGSNSDSHCVLLAGSQLRCWGENTSGQLGIGSKANIGDNELPSAAPLTPYK